MTIEEIKSVSIRQFLETNQINAVLKRGTKYWYNSPFRAESTPSFRVDPKLNLWYDFGPNEGGNIINLVQKMNPGWNNHQVLSYLEKTIKANNLQYSEDYEAREQEAQGKEDWKRRMKEGQDEATIVESLTQLSHPYLRDYIIERRIDYEIAKAYCKEVHYIVNGCHYYAIAFLNIEGGMEARNKFCKRCIGKKNISIVFPDLCYHMECCIFEGFFDMLTYATYEKWMDIGITLGYRCDLIVLNSVSNLKLLLPYLDRYSLIHCYLDNDNAGKSATKSIMELYPKNTIDESIRYNGYNDLNDVICGKPATQPTGK